MKVEIFYKNIIWIWPGALLFSVRVLSWQQSKRGKTLTAERSIGSAPTAPANQNACARVKRSQARAKLGPSELRFRITEWLRSVFCYANMSC